MMALFRMCLVDSLQALTISFKFMNDKLCNCCSILFNPKRFHIIGDSAFPFEEWCLSSYEKGTGWFLKNF
jgi:hypothetical protein